MVSPLEQYTNKHKDHGKPSRIKQQWINKIAQQDISANIKRQLLACGGFPTIVAGFPS